MAKKRNNRRQHTRLKLLRKILHLTQSQLARLLNVSESYILAIEIGQRQLTPAIAERIALQTNIDPFWLLHSDKDRQGQPYSDGRPVDRLGRPYDQETFRNGTLWAGKVEKLTPQMRDATNHACVKCAKVLRLAARAGRFDSAWFISEAAFTQVWREFKLGRDAAEDSGELEDHRIPEDLAGSRCDAPRMIPYVKAAEGANLLRQTLAPNLFLDISRAVSQRLDVQPFIRDIERAVEYLRTVKPLRRTRRASQPQRRRA